VIGAAGAAFRRVLQVSGAVCVVSDGVSLRRAGRRRGLQAAACGYPADCRDGGVPVAAIPARHRLLASRRSAAWPSGGSMADLQIAEVAASLLPRFWLGTVSSRRTGQRQDSGGVSGQQIAEAATASSRLIGAVVWLTGSAALVSRAAAVVSRGEAMPRRRRWFRGGDRNSS
jgi:hypothetical protein